MTDQRDLSLTDVNAHSCSCCAPASQADQGATETAAREDGAAVESSYLVQGMTCSHCVSSVTEELSALPGVRDVRVDLNAGGVSTVTVRSESPLTEDAVASAVDEAGYTLAR